MNLTRIKSLREVVLGNNCFSLLTHFSDMKNLEILDVSYNKLLEIDKLQPLKTLHKLRVLCIEGNMMQRRFAHYEKLIRDMLGASSSTGLVILDQPDLIREYSQYDEETVQICYPKEVLPAQPPLLPQLSAPLPKNASIAGNNERSRTPNKMKRDLILAVKAPSTINLKSMKSPPRTSKNQVGATRAFEFGTSK